MDTTIPILFYQDGAYASSDYATSISAASAANHFTVHSLPNEASVFFFSSNSYEYSGKEMNKIGVIKTNEPLGVLITGLTKENGMVCFENVGTNKCKDSSNWEKLNWRFDAAQNWSKAGGMFPNYPAGTEITFYAKDTSNGANTKSTVKFVAHDKICRYQDSAPSAVFGGSSGDPENGAICSTEGAKVTGTGSFKKAYICQCY